MDRHFHKVLTTLRELQLELAESTLSRTPENVNDFYVACGEWRGLEKAHQIIESVLQDDEEEARR